MVGLVLSRGVWVTIADLGADGVLPAGTEVCLIGGMFLPVRNLQAGGQDTACVVVRRCGNHDVER